MKKEERIRKNLIYILKNYEVYYITKNKVDRDVYKLEELEKEIAKENETVNKLFAIKNNEIRVNGKASDKIEALLVSCLNNMSYLNNQKNKGNYLDIKDSDTLEEIADKIRKICVDTEIDVRDHKLTEEEEKILRNASVNELKTAKNKGINEEREYIKKKYQEMKAQEELKRKQDLEDMELSDDEEIIPENSLTYKLKQARQQGLKAEERFISKK